MNREQLIAQLMRRLSGAMSTARQHIPKGKAWAKKQDVAVLAYMLWALDATEIITAFQGALMRAQEQGADLVEIVCAFAHRLEQGGPQHCTAKDIALLDWFATLHEQSNRAIRGGE